MQHSSLSSQYVSYEENEVLQIRIQEPTHNVERPFVMLKNFFVIFVKARWR